MIILFWLFSFTSWAQQPPVHWSSALKITERHEFYQNNEVITKPKSSWQTLFAIVYPDINLKMFKDCVYYRIPGETQGILKIKSVKVDDPCENHQDAPGNSEIINLKALQFSLDSNEIILNITLSDYRNMRWKIPLVNNFSRPETKLFLSSAELKTPKIILLAPQKVAPDIIAQPLKKNEKTLCHDIKEDCREISPSTCNQCPDGWFEAPNGCSQGPKFCGYQNCGLKNRPACRKGMKHQRERKRFHCRTDSSFAFCSPGLSIQCMGDQAWCN